MKIEEINYQKNRCNYCGEFLIERTFSSDFIEKFKRINLFCSKCGVILEKPFSTGFTLKIMGPERHPLEKVLKISCQIRNTLKNEFSGFLGIAINNSSKYDLTINPSLVFIKLRRKEKRKISFTIKFGKSMPIGIHYIKFIFVRNLNVTIATKPVVMVKTK